MAESKVLAIATIIVCELLKVSHATGIQALPQLYPSSFSTRQSFMTLSKYSSSSTGISKLFQHLTMLHDLLRVYPSSCQTNERDEDILEESGGDAMKGG